LAQTLSWPRDEAELVTELQSGSETAFDWLVTHYHGPVYGLIAGLVGDAGEAADITQEVFLKAFRGLGSFRRGSSLRTWLYRIAVREALNARRWWWRHHRRQTSIESDEENGAPKFEIEDRGESPLDLAESNETQRMVRRGLQQVPEVFRGAVILRDIEGMSYEEVAEVLDVSVGTVKSRILRGRQSLREILAPLVERPVHVLALHDVAASRADQRPAVLGGVALERSNDSVHAAQTGARAFGCAPRSTNFMGGPARAERNVSISGAGVRRTGRYDPPVGGAR
jgi:RNA polymerase sigma-70 factor (ECF subfamily)